MKPIAFICMAIATVALGCQSPTHPGSADVELRVIAKPKAGVKEHFARVTVYDAAPVKAAASGQFEHVDYSNLSDIIVWLEPTNAENRAVAAPHSIDVDPGKPNPYIHAASVGQTILFHNRTSRPVPLYSVSDGNDFELPAIAPGENGEYTVRSEGLIELLSDPGQPPIIQIYAAPSKWVARTRSGSTVNFSNVPPGEYQAISWHPRLPGGSTPLTLSAGQRARSTLTLGVNALPEVQNK